MAILSLGFSGSRHGMSEVQKDALYRILKQHEGIFRHGDCMGADAEAHDIARALHPRWTIHIHPPIKNGWRAFKKGDSESPPKDYFVRNADIVNSSQYMVMCPNSARETGGTWWTINYARKNNAQFSIILPDGTVGHSRLYVGDEQIRS